MIIDTFQKVRDSRNTVGKSGMYAGDYDDITALKSISDRFGIAVVVVHHVRKMKDANGPFNEVTGSTGITGAADTSFILRRNRSSEMGTLLATGRDIEYQELTLKFDNSTLFMGACVAEERRRSSPRRDSRLSFSARFVHSLTQNLARHSKSATYRNDETEVTANVVTKLLARFSAEVLMPQGIEYRTKRTGTSRLIRLEINDSDDGNDGEISI